MLRLVVLTFCVFSITTGEFVVAGILPRVGEDLGVPVGTAGLLVTAYALGMIVGGPVLTTATVGVDRRRLMSLLLLVATAANVGSAVAGGFWQILVARFCAGLVTSTFFAQAIVVVVRSAPPDRAGSMVSRLAFGMNLAMILGAPLGTLIGNHWGWRATFIAVAGSCSVGLVLVLRLIAPSAGGRERGSARSELRVLARGEVLTALTITVAGNIGVLMVFTYLAPLLTEVGGHPAGRLPLLVLTYGVGATVGNLVGGVLHDRFPRRSGSALLGLLAALLLVCWFGAGSTVGSTVGVVLIGFLGFAVVPGMQARVLTAAAQAPTIAMAVNASGYQVAAGSAGLLGGLLIDSAGGPGIIFVVASALTGMGLVVTLLADRADVGVTRVRERGR